MENDKLYNFLKINEKIIDKMMFVYTKGQYTSGFSIKPVYLQDQDFFVEPRFAVTEKKDKFTYYYVPSMLKNKTNKMTDDSELVEVYPESLSKKNYEYIVGQGHAGLSGFHIKDLSLYEDWMEPEEENSGKITLLQPNGILFMSSGDRNDSYDLYCNAKSLFRFLFDTTFDVELTEEYFEIFTTNGFMKQMADPDNLEAFVNIIAEGENLEGMLEVYQLNYGN